MNTKPRKPHNLWRLDKGQRKKTFLETSSRDRRGILKGHLSLGVTTQELEQLSRWQNKDLDYEFKKPTKLFYILTSCKEFHRASQLHVVRETQQWFKNRQSRAKLPNPASTTYQINDPDKLTSLLLLALAACKVAIIVACGFVSKVKSSSAHWLH